MTSQSGNPSIPELYHELKAEIGKAIKNADLSGLVWATYNYGEALINWTLAQGLLGYAKPLYPDNVTLIRGIRDEVEWLSQYSRRPTGLERARRFYNELKNNISLELI